MCGLTLNWVPATGQRSKVVSCLKLSFRFTKHQKCPEKRFGTRLSILSMSIKSWQFVDKKKFENPSLTSLRKLLDPFFRRILKKTSNRIKHL